MGLPRDGMQIFPRYPWDGLSEELTRPDRFQSAGPDTSRKIIDTILGIQNYLTPKTVALPDIDTDLSTPNTTVQSASFTIIGNTIRIDALDVSQAVNGDLSIVWGVDLGEYLSGITDADMSGPCVYQLSTALTRASITYKPSNNTLWLTIIGAEAVDVQPISLQATLM